MSMIDPVNRFHIPDAWIERTGLPSKEIEERIASGLYVLLSNGQFLRRGYTTGTTAAAAAKASVLSLKKVISKVSVPTPIGLRVILSVTAKEGTASAWKDSGDYDSDATKGIEIRAQAEEYETLVIRAGPGIGIKNGIPAINPIPMSQIEGAVSEALLECGFKGAKVTISVPRGEQIAKRTLNGQLGITGGISILGTTGFVEPWNEHLAEMKEELIRSADKVVLTTGRLGMRISHMLFPDYEVVLMGSDLSRGLKAAQGKVIIAGLPGLILKWSMPDILEKIGYVTIAEMIEDDPGNPLIDRGLKQAMTKSGKRVVLLNRDGTILRDSGEPL